MILPITESILRGELRPNLITETVSFEKQSLLMRLLRHTKERGNLLELEKDIINALDSLTQVKEIYHKDREQRNTISCLNRSTQIDSYTRVYKAVLSDIMTCPEISTPTLRMYKTILDLEKRRTIWALVELHSIMKDDRFVRPEIKSLMTTIKDYCKEIDSWKAGKNKNVAVLLQNMLTELYFSLILTFSPLLYTQGNLDFDDDFGDFVFLWKGVFPTEEEFDKYQKEKDKIKEENIVIRHKDALVATEENKQKEKRPLNKAERFLEDTTQYDFLKMPKIVALDSNNDNRRKEKAIKLIGQMLDAPAHAAAMLDYLGFFSWIKDKYETGYTLTAYDHFCTKVVMGQNGEAFKKYRLAIKRNSKSLKPYQYSGDIEQEYANIKNEVQ